MKILAKYINFNIKNKTQNKIMFIFDFPASFQISFPFSYVSRFQRQLVRKISKMKEDFQ